MKYLKPEVILLAYTQLDVPGLVRLLQTVGAEKYWPNEGADGEKLIEVAGRLCYRSFEAGLNANVTKVREGNKVYLENILKSKHGSVLEHSTVTFAFMNVSRIFTHEIVRHRAGTAFSQESMRYVRMDHIGMYEPESLKDTPHNNQIQETSSGLVKLFESWYKDTCKLLKLDEATDFDYKKKITSALRRWAPGGHTTNIIVTANHRAWRHMIEQRNDIHAEEEIQKIFHRVGDTLKSNFPHIYQDMTWENEHYVFKHSKV